MPPDSERRLRRLSDSLLGENHGGVLELKSYVHALAHIPKRGRYSLKDKTVDRLYEVRPDVLESLPEFRPAPEFRGRPALDRRPEHSKAVHDLLDQSVFRTFRFARLAG